MSVMVLRQFGPLTSGGASKAASFIAEQTQDARRRLQESYALGQQAKRALSDLSKVFEYCQRANWDGYGALPVSARAFRLAYEFLEALPLGTRAPSVGAEPDGHLTLEWHRSPHRTLSLSISPEDEIHYSALIGASKHYGTEPFYGEVPKVIIELISRVVAE